MEAYVIGIGMIPCLELWETDLRGVKLPFEYPKGNKKNLIRLGVDKVQLYRIRFPKEHLEVVSQMLGITNYIEERFPAIRRSLNIFRKVMKLKKLEIPKKVIEHMQPDQINKAVAIIPLGIKEDLHTKDGMELV